MNIFIFISFILLAACSIFATLAVYWHSEYSILAAKVEARRQRLEAFMHGEIDEEVERVFSEEQ